MVGRNALVLFAHLVLTYLLLFLGRFASVVHSLRLIFFALHISLPIFPISLGSSHIVALHFILLALSRTLRSIVTASVRDEQLGLFLVGLLSLRQ